MEQTFLTHWRSPHDSGITVVRGHLNELSVSSQQIQEQKLKLPIELELFFAFSVK
ncbi:hypothetical protein CGCTS75_v010963 [Colletotrichum tropicale]|nr:hypothetical protein CGCTS75_v010963 [Colletotrichum tropicale]